MLLDVKNLSLSFRTAPQGKDKTEGSFKAVDSLSFSLKKGEALGLVGESGSGKSVTALSLLQLFPPGLVSYGKGSSILFKGEEVIGASSKRLRQLRGQKIGMIFQEPMSALNPLHTVEKQIGETLILHQGLSQEAARHRVLDLLDCVKIPQAKQRLGAFPHELSGGQCQRVMIAMALANRPDLLVADEPTTALDVTIQAEILDLLTELRREFEMSLLMISHDLSAVEKVAEQVVVMKEGKAVEQGGLKDVFSHPKNSYTRMLLEAGPSGSAGPLAPKASCLLQGKALKVYFPIKKGLLRKTVSYRKAVDDVSLSLLQGETLGIVGESGSGKTTLGRALLRLVPLTEGELSFQGKNLLACSAKEMNGLRRDLQIVFQDPYGALNPRKTVAQIVGEGLDAHKLYEDKIQRDENVIAALEEVGLEASMKERYPHSFSGGQRQRIAIARALVLKPKVIVLDEPTSALDRSVQKTVLELLKELRERRHLSYVFISHDLDVVRSMSHRILVLKDGKVVEEGATEDIFKHPKDPYTQRLLESRLTSESFASSS